MTRVLLTTVHRDFGLYDYFRENAPEGFAWRFRMPRRISFGLRFLRQNVSGLEILEYPTHAEYLRTLKKGWDVVGFSFYLEESNQILRMAEEARAAGAAQLWAGNYGATKSSAGTAKTRWRRPWARPSTPCSIHRWCPNSGCRGAGRYPSV